MIARYLMRPFLLFTLLTPCVQTSAQDCESISSYDQARNLNLVQEGSLSFGFKFFQTMNRQDENSNLCLSPFSAAMALSMTLNGAEGETLKQMAETLGYSELTPGEINCAYRDITAALENAGTQLRLENANSIWIRKGLPVYDEFISTNRSTYNAEVSTLDFDDPDASKTINAWVKEETKEKIDGIVPDVIDGSVMMYLINAIYFKGMWRTEFNKEATRKETFTLPGGTKIEHDLMNVEGTFAYAMLEDETQIIELPYKAGKGKFGMVVILPPEGEEIGEYVQDLSERSFRTMFDALDRDRQKGTLFLPKFTLEYEETLNNALISMGMKKAFQSKVAEFGGISAIPLYISNVRQKTFVEVNEEGTEAAAATSVEMSYESLSTDRPPPFVMRVDRPFLFVIASSDPDAILFFGKVVDPRGE